MPPEYETPLNGGVSRKRCGDCFLDSLTPLNLKSQFLIAAYHIRPDVAAMMAALAFGGGGAHG